MFSKSIIFVIAVYAFQFVVLSTSIAPPVELGDECTDDVNCTTVFGDLSECFDNGKKSYCSCNLSTSVPQQDKKKCLLKVNELNGTCSESLQCHHGTPGAFSNCTEGKCQCIADTVANGTTNCLQIINEIGDRCRDVSQCQAGVLGALTICNATDEGDEPTRRVCQCSEGANVTAATTNICQCIAGEYYEAPSGSKRCLKYHDGVGDDAVCEENNQCRAVNSTCANNVCSCNEGHWPYDSKCYLKSTLHGDCKETGNCIVGISQQAVCQNNTCHCKKDSLEKENSCWEIKKIGDTCNDNKICEVNIGGNAECTDDTCACKAGTTPNSEKTQCSGALSMLNQGAFQLTLFIAMLLKYLS